MKIGAIAPWFGSNRTLAANVGAALKGCRWVGVGFAGGMCELAHIDAPSIVVNDLHAHVLNLAAVAGDENLNPRLVAELDALPCDPDVLRFAQQRCIDREQDPSIFGGTVPLKAMPKDVSWAVDYFVSAWMSRNGTAGTKGEFKAGQSVRWDAGGGDSATRFRNATAALAEWLPIMRRCNFVRMCVFEFLELVQDHAGHGVYLDPPFPDVGDSYKHWFSMAHQFDLSERLVKFARCRVVCRFYDHPLVRKLYPEPAWAWHHFDGRRQTNDDGPEVLLVRNRA